ncbi:MAG TPA: outer membrane beta-barrel protein, partial [Chitinophagaceae bacterium]|nr:outer membrane beta-barrel protein [Chitinophagaceae bacterium]
MRYLIVCFCATLFAISTQAQTPVTFKLHNSKKEPVAFATVAAIPVPDTVNKVSTLSDSTGSAVLQLQKNRPYLIQITSIGYDPIQRNISVKLDNPVFYFNLKESSKSLANVVVTAKKPLMRQEDDKTIVDPENLAASSTNAYEIMEKTPGLFIDQDGNIYLTSTTPATVYINGREQKMSAADMATILKSLPPNAIQAIEIMRTPSAKYDASGSGGIVNVILKKGIKIGLTGSINGGINQGKYGNQFIGFSLNNSSGRLSSYMHSQFSRRATYEQIKTDRIFSIDTVLRQDALTVYPANSNYIGYGISYEISKKWELSYDGRLNYNRSRNRSSNISDIVKMSTDELLTSNLTLVKNKGYNVNINQGIELEHKIDSLGSEWKMELSYTYAPNNTDQTFTTNFITPSFPPTSGDGDLENRPQYFTAETDFVKKFPHQITFETGLKSTN